MNRSVLKLASSVAALLIPLTSQAIRDDLPTLFEEDVLLYAEIPSVPQLQDNWKENPLYELYQREDVKEFVDSYIGFFRSGNGENGEFFEDEEDKEIVTELLKGQLALSFSRTDFLSFFPNPLEPRQSRRPRGILPDILLIASFENEDLLKKMIDEMEDDEDEFEEYEDFYIILNEPIVEFFNEDTFGVTNSEETARSFIERYHGLSTQPSLADNENFQRSFLRLYEESDLYYYLDLSVIADIAADATEKYGEISLAMIQSGQLSPNDTILEALGLEALQGLSGSLDLDPEEQKFRSLFTSEPNDGFFGRLIGHYGSSLPDTSFLSEDLSQAVASSFDISAMLRDLERTVAAVSPMAGQLYAVQKWQLEQSLSVQIDQSLINNFSGSFYLASGETPNMAALALGDQLQGMEAFLNQGNTYILGINDRVSLEALFDSLLVTFNQQERFPKQDYLGVSNYSATMPGAALGPSLFISDQHLIFEQSNPDFGKLVVSMMQDPGYPIFERRDVRDSLNELPPDPISVTYTDAQKLIKTFSTMMNKAIPIMAQHAAEGGPPERSVDSDSMDLPEDIPIVDDFSYFTITTTYKEDDDLYQEGILRPKSN